jgi:tRNA pseudouridine55 synthase
MKNRTVNGILNINKPEGMTSFSVISRLRHVTGQKHVGHTGTLDPIATGVLPVCFGQATRISRFITESDKTYVATIKLGISTDTYDREGKITGENDFSGITPEQATATLQSFCGTIKQVPPAFSAIKLQGQKLYKLARSGIMLKPEAREVTINHLHILSMELPLISVEIDCSKGTYIRSLAHDLGQVLGCGAHLTKLERTRCGIFTIKDAVELSAAEQAVTKREWESLLHPIDYPLTSYIKVILDNEQENQVRRGLSVQVDTDIKASAGLILAYNTSGSFIAMLNYDTSTGLWHPYRVFASISTDE